MNDQPARRPTYEDLKDDPNLAHLDDVRVARMASIDSVAQSGIKGLTIINGGAIVALFTLLAQGSQSPFVKKVDVGLVIWSAAAFALGLFAIVAANLMGYAAQQTIGWWEQAYRQAYIAERLGQAGAIDSLDSRSLNRANATLTAAGWVAGCSLLAFFTGCALALAASLGAAK